MTDPKDLTPEEMAHWRELLPVDGICDEDIFEKQVLVATTLLERAIAQIERLQAAHDTLIVQRCETCRHNQPRHTRSMGMVFNTPWCNKWQGWRPINVTSCTAYSDAYEPKETAHD